MDSNSAAGDGVAVSAVERIGFDVEWSPGFVSAFVVPGDEPVLVDAGMPSDDNERTLDDGLAEVSLQRRDIEHVLVTHPHVDHIGLVQSIREGGATVYAPASYRKRLRRPASKVKAQAEATVRTVGVPDEMVEYAVDSALEQRSTIRSLLRDEWVDVWVDDGGTLRLGGSEFTALSTPGHHQDHQCFVADLDAERGSERALFSGDMAVSTFRTPVLHAYFQPEQRAGVAAYHTALDTLSHLEVDRVYPGHGPVHSDLNAALDTSRKSLERLCDRTEATLRESGTHAVHVASQRADDITSGPWLPEAVAALSHLERTGRAESYLEDGVRYYVPV